MRKIFATILFFIAVTSLADWKSGGGGSSIAVDLVCAVAGCVDEDDIADDAVTSDKVDFNYATSVSKGGPATTSSALAANPTNCSAGTYPLGIDAGGNVEGCNSTIEATTGDSATNFFTTGQLAFARLPSVSWVRALATGTQSMNDGALTEINFDSESHDTSTYHFTSSAALTGTVAKTATSTAIVGTGTTFTTELSLFQVITIPGTAVEYCVVATITDNTNLNCYQTMANSATGQTATRKNTALVAPFTGVYDITCTIAFALDTAGTTHRGIFVRQSGSIYTGIESQSAATTGTSGSIQSASGYLAMITGDFVECQGRHVSGAALNTVQNTGDIPMFQMKYEGL